MITGQDIVIAAREWLDTPFVHQGRKKGVGVDCLGLAVGAMRECGLAIYDEEGYAKQPNGRLEKTLRKLLVPGDGIGSLMLFRIRHAPQHVGVRTDIGVIHAYSGIGKVVEHNLDEFWSTRLIQSYALPGVTYVD